LINFFTVKVSGYDVITRIAYYFSFLFSTENSPNDIKFGHFDGEKVDQDEFFYYKDTLHFFSEWPKYYTYQKLYLGLIALECYTLSQFPPQQFLQIFQVYLRSISLM
jgi:hypothetical protein